MHMDTNTKEGPMFLLVASLLGCAPPQPAYFEGMLLDDITFVYASDAHGIYPNTGILTDGSNPFANRPLWAGKWDVESYGYPPASYYAWATQLAVEATGENQELSGQRREDLKTRKSWGVGRGRGGGASGGYEA